MAFVTRPGPNLVWTESTPDDWSGQGRHYAFVKNADEGTLSIYHDGIRVAQLVGNYESFEGSEVSMFTIGTTDWGHEFVGKISDFRLYNYALSHEEVVHLAKGPAGSVVQPLGVPFDADVTGDGHVGLANLVQMSLLWLEQDLVWPAF